MRRATGSAVCGARERVRRRAPALLALLLLRCATLADCFSVNTDLVNRVSAKRSDTESDRLDAETGRRSRLIRNAEGGIHP